jgi:HPt (histidine-containing phosphotransfer) domain-containing protein
MVTNHVKEEYLTRKVQRADFGEALDRQVLAELWEDLEADEALIRELITLFLEDAPKQLGNAREAFVRADSRELGRIAHTLKSSSLYYGAKNLSEVCGAMESVCQQGQLTNADLLIAGMEKEFELVKTALQSMMPNSHEFPL